ncbi:MAG: hypothetical protein M1834_008000 [Cirrosporium novae-zelandiae]|nr:MAG: hypothetical protein M1834_008000 [Cirrosporium novae-zelandiae]
MRGRGTKVAGKQNVIASALSGSYNRIQQSLWKSTGKAKAKKVIAVWEEPKFDGDESHDKKDEDGHEVRNGLREKELAPQEKAENEVREAHHSEREERLIKKISVFLNPPELLSLINNDSHDHDHPKPDGEKNSLPGSKP